MTFDVPGTWSGFPTFPRACVHDRLGCVMDSLDGFHREPEHILHQIGNIIARKNGTEMPIKGDGFNNGVVAPEPTK